MSTANISAAPKVSVIIPAYNTAHLIGTCLDSVFAQTYRDFEIIVVNDGSPDTPDLEVALRPYLARIVYVAQANKRAAGARNTAIARARGEFLAFLDSDDSWMPQHLANQMALFEKDPSLGLVYADAELITRSSRRKAFSEKCPSEGEATFEALAVERCQVPVSTVVARKAAIVKAGLFDENIPQCEDYDMWLRTAFHGTKIAYRREAQARLNVGRPGSLSHSRAKLSKAHWKILEKTATTPGLTEFQQELLRNRTAEVKAGHLLEEGKHQLRDRHPEKARELFAEANRYFRRPKLEVAIRGLQFAPQATGRLMLMWERFRIALTV